MKINIIKTLNLDSDAWRLWALLLFSILFNPSVKAQDTITVVNHLIDTQIKNQIFKYPITFTNQNIKDFTFTEVSYEHQQNEFARKQIANEINSYQFLAQGYYTTKSDWKLFGDLSIKKIDEKNLGWVLSDDRAEESEIIAPHYFFVPRKANWTNQQYRLNGGFSKKITNAISVAAKINYDTEKYSRNLDPRPEIISRKIGGEIQLGYQITQNHKAFALTDYSRKDKDYSYLYKNDHLNFEAYPDTYLRFNTGYGRIINYLKSNSSTTVRFVYEDLNTKTGIGYTYSDKKNIFSAVYYHQRSNNSFFISYFSNEEYVRFKYETKINHIELFTLHKWNNNQLKSTFKYNQSDGVNYDISSKGHNYKNAMNAMNWQTSISKRTNTRIDYLFGLELMYQQNKYNDILATSDIKLNSLNTGIYGSKDFAFNKSKINATINLNFYFALPSSQLDYYDTSGGKNETFFNEVVVHDYAVSTTNYFTPKLRLEYSYPIQNKTVVFFTDFKEKLALKKQNDYNTIINTNTTYWIQLGVQLNY
jgi:hypothetical protein